MDLEGRVIEFLDTDQLKLALVRKQERDKLHAVDPRGRNLSIHTDRVIVVHGPADEAELPAVARDIAARIADRQSEVDVELLWQSLAGSAGELQVAELAELYFAELSPESVSAVFRALSEDTLFFKRKGTRFVARTADQVDEERTRRRRRQEREELREQLTATITSLVRNREAPVPPHAAGLLDRLLNWLRQKTNDEAAAILEEVAGAGLARDVAYDILVRAGRIDRAADRFLVTAGIDSQFPPAIVEAADRVTPYAHANSRVDYRHLPAFTIDDDDTREVDDALTIERDGDELVVGIHIANVSAFVSKGDALDVEAARRGSTVYLPASTVRMFPERLSTGLASLNADGERPAYTVEVRFDATFRQVHYRIVLSTIRVAERLSYDLADARANDPGSDLALLYRLALELQRARAERGAITQRRPELKVRVHGDEIVLKHIDPNSPSRILVSELMILANGLSADFASVNALPVIFRTQEPRVATDENAAATATSPNGDDPLAFERLRKTFRRSRLSLSPGPHSGLGLSAYTQASSPIRRYADLITQRQFTALLSGREIPYQREELLRILSSAEAAEQEFRTLEDRATQYWLLRYLEREKRDAPLPAVVLDAKGTVELNGYYVRGKLADAAKPTPGTVISVRIDAIHPDHGEARFRAG